VHAETAIGALVEIVGNEKAPPAARVSAANALLDRGYGLPESKIDATVETPTQQFDLTKLSPERFALLEIINEVRVDGESDLGKTAYLKLKMSGAATYTPDAKGVSLAAGLGLRRLPVLGLLNSGASARLAAIPRGGRQRFGVSKRKAPSLRRLGQLVRQLGLAISELAG
jgi:hypothetical protein